MEVKDAFRDDGPCHLKELAVWEGRQLSKGTLEHLKCHHDKCSEKAWMGVVATSLDRGEVRKDISAEVMSEF